jgi:hypothetical protein
MLRHIFSIHFFFVGLIYTAMGDVLFSTIEMWHTGKAWGKVLDAGTGQSLLIASTILTMFELIFSNS